MDCAKWIGSLVVVGLLTVAGVAVAQTPAPPPPPPVMPQLRAALETCETSPLPVGRIASFVGAMPAVAGATRMQLLFDLQRRRSGERRWRVVRGVQGFGVWETSEPARAGFVFHKRVDGLHVPATYRARVRFRWADDDGEIVREARRHTRSCAQPDLRPDLVVTSLRAVLDARPAFALYTVTVRNDGRSAAGPFAVHAAGGISEVAGLAAGRQLAVTVIAPVCLPDLIVRATADADRRIDESDEHNALRRTCPLGR